MKSLTKQWVRKAEADLAVVRRIRKAQPPLRDETCYHCQQAAEKYLKALLQELGTASPHIHNLLEPLALLVPHDPSLASLRRSLRALRRYAVDCRYPGFNATARQTDAAVRQVNRTRTAIRKRLGLPPLRPIR